MLYFLHFLLIVRFAFGTQFKDCGSQEGKVVSLSVINCSDSADVCNFQRGTNASVSLIFSPSQPIDHLDVKVYGIIAGVPVPFQMPQPDACVNSGLQCPLAAQSTETYTTVVPVLSSYPKIKAGVKLELVDRSNGELVTCLAFRIQIVDPGDEAASPRRQRRPLLNNLYHLRGMPLRVNLFEQIQSDADVSSDKKARPQGHQDIKSPRNLPGISKSSSLLSSSKLRVEDPLEILRPKHRGPAQKETHAKKKPLYFSLYL